MKKTAAQAAQRAAVGGAPDRTAYLA
jgi:hypothetical protein